jgi:hypothetical protein
MNASLKIHPPFKLILKMTWSLAIKLLKATTKTRDEKEFMGNRELEPKLKKEWKVGEIQGNQVRKGPKSLVVLGKMPSTQKESRSH